MSRVSALPGCTPRRDVVVLKFGSSVLSGARGFHAAAEEIAREVRAGRHVVAVVSARGDTTDGLLGLIADVSDRPPTALVSSLLRTGEDASVCLLAMACTGRGLGARALSADELGLITRGDLLDGEPVGFGSSTLSNAVLHHPVTVVPGFVGRDSTGTPSLLGRGGSDLTALFIGVWLDAIEVRLVKDVDGVYTSDPSVPGCGAEPLASASWSEVARVGSGVVQTKALQFAERLDCSFRVAAIGGHGTWVGPAEAVCLGVER